MKNLFKLFLIVPLVLTLIAPIPSAFATTKTWTTDTDFNAGTKVGTKVTGTGTAASVELILGGPWYNASWLKRAPVTVNNTSGAALTDFQVKVNVTYNANMKTDFSDLRFTADDKITERSYWVESYTASTSAVVWVKLPSVPTGNSTIYMYYGNAAAATAGNGTNTFDFFDDAETGVLTGKWVQVTGTATSYSTDRAYSGSKSIKVDSTAFDQVIKMNVSSIPQILELAFYDDNDSSIYVSMETQRSGGPDLVGVAIDTNQKASYYIGLNGAGWVRPDNLSRSVGWHKAKLIMTGSMTYAYVDDIAQINGYSDTNLPVDFMVATATSLSRFSTFYFDDLRVRKYASTEPTSTTGAEENKP